MAAILQTTLQNAVSWIKMFWPLKNYQELAVMLLKLHCTFSLLSDEKKISMFDVLIVFD